MNAIVKEHPIVEIVMGARDAFQTLLADQSMVFEREASFALQALMRSDYTLKTAMSNRQSVVNAVANIAAIGLSLNPAKKQAYLVPRDGAVHLDISYMGLMDLAMQSGSVRWAQADVVYKADEFRLHGFDRAPTHRHDPFATDRGEIIGVYVVVKTADGDYLTETMTIAEINGVRDRSSAWKQSKSGPWKTDFCEMAKKTVVKRAYKYWPKTDRLDRAIHHLNTDGGEGFADLSVESDSTRTVEMPQPKSKPVETTSQPGQEPEARATEPATAPTVESDSTDSPPATVGEKAFIRNKLTAAGIDFDEAMAANRIGDFEALTKSQFAAVKSWIAKQ